jgi:hypothetical protein
LRSLPSTYISVGPRGTNVIWSSFAKFGGVESLRLFASNPFRKPPLIVALLRPRCKIELALPSFLSKDDRRAIAQEFAQALVDRYGVAASVALHRPGKNGDDPNYHAHILLTTRTMTPEGLGKKTRVLDDMKTGPQEVTKLRELAADIINEDLAAANSDIRVDHRSF